MDWLQEVQTAQLLEAVGGSVCVCVGGVVSVRVGVCLNDYTLATLTVNSVVHIIDNLNTKYRLSKIATKQLKFENAQT